MRNRRLVVVAVIVLVALVAAVAGAVFWSSRSGDSVAQGDRLTLVAIGDSFTSGAGVRPYDNADCERSQLAYPKLAGKKLDMEVKNVACAGATSKAVVGSFRDQPPQASELAGADYIVGTLGGNDVNTLQSIAAVASGGLPAYLAGLPRMKAGLTDAYREVRAAAPEATIYAVTYPDIIPRDAVTLAQCYGGIAANVDLAALHAGAKALNTAITEAATDAGVQVIDASQAFAGHEICTLEPWVVAPDLAGAGHPNEGGHRALAELVVATIREQSPR